MTMFRSLLTISGALASLAIVASLALAGCGAAQQQAAPAAASGEPLPESATCPVMKTTFKPDASTTRTEYNGKAYYFCCPGCDKKFAADPESYVKGECEPAAEGGASE